MSQIAAILGNQPAGSDRIRAMAQVLQQFPHDASAVWSDENCAAAACTLHTTEESRDAEQPHSSEDGQIVLVLDGYLANYDDLRRDLGGRGIRLRDTSDGELILRAYEQWGRDCPRHIEGEFAFVILDRRENLLFCARDHHGLRPLYYTVEGGVFMAASRIAVLLAGKSERPQPNREFLAELAIADFASLEQTAWSGIYRAPPASSMTFRGDRLQVSRYYDLPAARVHSYRTDKQYIEAYRDMLGEVVRKASRSCAPIAFDVSGGLDSSSLYCMAHKLEESGQIQAPAIRGYTLTAETNSPADEVEYARAAARHVDGTLVEVPLFLPSLDWFARLTRDERDIGGFPNGAQSIGATRQMARDGVRVVVGGNGGDQWLDGSSAFLEQNLRALKLGSYWRTIRSEIDACGVSKAVPSLIRRTVLGLLPHRLRGAIRRTRNGRTGVYDAQLDYVPVDLAKSIQERRKAADHALPDDPVALSKQSSFGSAWTRFANDLMSRQYASEGIEWRNPLLSRQFIEFCNSVPEDMKRRNGTGRWIHRQALTEILPREILERRTKASFHACLEPEKVLKILAGDWPEGMAEVVDRDSFEEMVSHCSAEFSSGRMQFELWGLLLVHQFLLDFALQKD